MTACAIPRSEWRTTLDTFSLTHRGWPVTIAVNSPVAGVQPEVRELPLSGISLSVGGDDPAVVITMSRHQPEHVTHLVEHVRHLWVEHAGVEDTGLQLDTADGTRTVLRCAKPDVGGS